MKDIIGLGSEFLEDLFTDYGLIALQEKLITGEDVADFWGGKETIFSESGITLLREKLYTMNELKAMDFEELRLALTDEGLESRRRALPKSDEWGEVKVNLKKIIGSS